MRQSDPPLTLTADLVFAVLLLARLADVANLQVYHAHRADAGSAVRLASKADASPPTTADLLAHDCIVLGLACLMPGVAVLSEEDAASFVARRPQGELWLVAPLDGTKEFLAKGGEFTVNIALIRDGRALCGVVSAPALGLAYWGGRGISSYREDDGGEGAADGCRKRGLGATATGGGQRKSSRQRDPSVDCGVRVGPTNAGRQLLENLPGG